MYVTTFKKNFNESGLTKLKKIVVGFSKFRFAGIGSHFKFLKGIYQILVFC